MAADYVPVSFSLPPHMKANMDKIARIQGLDRSAVARLAFTDYIAATASDPGFQQQAREWQAREADLSWLERLSGKPASEPTVGPTEPTAAPDNGGWETPVEPVS